MTPLVHARSIGGVFIDGNVSQLTKVTKNITNSASGSHARAEQYLASISGDKIELRGSLTQVVKAHNIRNIANGSHPIATQMISNIIVNQ
ncbi:MAG: hypothetical protein Q9M50_11210 [Methylococcales bacterium]|nr:hypothetical protein [Methylococcales bacterium]